MALRSVADVLAPAPQRRKDEHPVDNDEEKNADLKPVHAEEPWDVRRALDRRGDEEEWVPDGGVGEALRTLVGGAQAVVLGYQRQQRDQERVDDEHLEEGENLHPASTLPVPSKDLRARAENA